MKTIKSFKNFTLNEYLSPNNLYYNVNSDIVKQIKGMARFYKTKKYINDCIPAIQEYLFTEFKWKRENEVVNVLRKGTTKLIDSIMPYHEVVEYLAHGGETDTWDWAHPVAVDITGNRLKEVISELIPYTNDEIQEATCPLLHGYQLTGNYFLDNDPKTKDDLTKREREAFEIILKNQEKESIYRNIETVLEELINGK